MYPKDKDPKAVPTSYSSSESDQKRESSASHKDARRRESSSKSGPRQGATPKSFKATRKKGDPKEMAPCGPFLRSYLNSQCPTDSQVPSSDGRSPSLKSNANKTDSAGGNNEENGEAAGGRESVFVRETKASRLRAASRTPVSEVLLSSKSSTDARKSEKNVPKLPVSSSPTFNSPSKKDIDKSHSRKSHLNRSHTSEGVYDDTYVPGGSNTRRRRSKNLSFDPSPVKTVVEKSVKPRIPTMGNANATPKDFHIDPLPVASPLNTFRRSTALLDRSSLKPLPKKCSGDELLKTKRSTTDHRVDRSKQIDIATRAEILAASTLKMINRLDEINDKSRRAQDDVCKKLLPLNPVINSENSGILISCPDAKKVPSPTTVDDATAKSSFNRTRVKTSPKKSLEEKKPDVKHSILKNKPSGTSSLSGDVQKPVSILKRKSLSQEDAQSCSPPVTFDPSVLKKEPDAKRQGILKKRRSLDENEVMRRRSYSPDASYDFKSILKNQRRSSMEELTRRSRSPDSTPQGILKRKPSREEENEDERQGILKRKSLPCLSVQNVKISENATVGDVSENVRPILKKKSSSEDQSASDLSIADVPKSILKKKTNLEMEEPEEKPKKPILKTCRAPSFEEGGGAEEPKAILKRENGRSRECGNDVVLRRASVKQERLSSQDIDSELSAIFLKRRSLEFQPVSATNFDLELQKTKRASSSERLRGNLPRRPLSVAEKINNLENFLEVERIEREKRNSPPRTPPFNLAEERLKTAAGAFDGAMAPELESTPVRNRASLESTTDEEPSRQPGSSLKGLRSVDTHAGPWSKAQVDLTTRKSPSAVQLPGCSIDSQEFFSPDTLQKLPEWKNDADCSSPIESFEEKISLLSLKDNPTGTSEVMDSEDLFLLQRSGSVSAKASLFKEIEKKCQADASAEKIKRSPSGNAGINRRREKKLLESNAQRYRTQPVSTEEVELAVRNKITNAGEKREDEEENHEDELCKMSYKDRLRLFESTFTPRFLEPNARKRGGRYKTQPVTTDEVETAKSRRSKEVASATSSDPAEDSSGLARFRQSTEDRLGKPRAAEEKSKPKSILKNLNVMDEAKGSISDSDSSDGEQRRKTLKSELNESLQSLKKVLKKVEKEATSELKGILKQPSFSEKKKSSSSEEEGEEEGIKPRGGSLRANLAAILQRVEPVGQMQEGKSKPVPRHMQNPGIARAINRTRTNDSLVKSQSHSSVSSVLQTSSKCPLSEGAFAQSAEENRLGRGSDDRDETDESVILRSGLRRSATQPLGPSEEGSSDDMSGCSIRERLARLKRSGELDWQKRKSHVTNLEDELSVITAGNYLFNENCLLRGKSRKSPPQPSKESEELRNSSSILADRLGKLDAAKEGWRKRIQPSDAVRFSVEGKMLEKRDSLSPPNAPHLVSPTRTPLADRKKRSPKAAKFRSKQCNLSLNSVPSSPSERTGDPIARSMSAPGGGKNGLFTSFVGEEVNGPVVTVPKIDDETFTSFFDGLSTERMFQERLEIKDEDLDAVTRMKSSQLLVQKRNVKTQKRRATAKNPVKALAARLSHQEYTEIKTGIAEKELKRMKIEKAAKSSTLAIEALAGLASQEDFKAISLKKATEGSVAPDAPYKELMLLQVKGRRHVQTRLVEPVAKNINEGDCFVLVTPNRVFHYVGEFANVIERSRGAEISSHVQQTGDLGCTASSVVTIGEGGRATREQAKEFWGLLGGEQGAAQKTGDLDEDELYESALVDTNMVYEMVNEEFVPVDAYWGSIPKIEILDPNKVLVFDFGSEFYVWNGKNVSLSKRRTALKLAKELWEEGYDYTDCDLCPLTAASHLGGRIPWEEIPDSEKAGPVRPCWSLFGKITQNMETVLFREKFLDWPDYARVIRRGKNKNEEAEDWNGTPGVKPCDAKKMLENVVAEADLVLEGSHLGRGVRYFDEETRRCSEIATQDVTVWHVNEYEYSEVPEDSFGHFHMEDSYVVRWHYVITLTGRELSGQPSKHLTTGRNRYAYFFWHGRDSPINDKGAAACLTVELDKEHGPQVRVVQALEPPAFLNLFQGGMVVHQGRRCSGVSREKWRMFICRGEAESESVLFELPCSMRQLRSLASFLLINNRTGLVIVWHGWKSPEGSRKIAVAAAKRLRPETPEFEFKGKEIAVREETEGSESQEFFRALGGDNRQLYYSLLQDKTEVKTPRLYHLTSVSGEFQFTEVSSPHLFKGSTTPLPFLQTDLYSASQPALFLLDASCGLWLWQGWWEESSESERGSGYRFQAERRAAMETAMTYWNTKYGATTTPKAYLIWAGLEPLVFTNQFPFWIDRDDAAESNMKDGRKPGEATVIKTELASLTQSTYPLAQLLNRPLPEGVNPTSLEDYLESQCFPDLFGMEKEEFLNLPSWKKRKLKQEAGLF